MSRLNTRSSLALAAVALVVGASWWLPGRESPASSAVVAPDAKSVRLELTIEDAASGLSLSATRNVPTGTSALDAMRSTVSIETKEFDGLGTFVVRLCGVEPAKGKFWSPAVDGEKSKTGIGRIVLEKDTKLSWTIKDAQAN
jgi:hypothetical protein